MAHGLYSHHWHLDHYPLSLGLLQQASHLVSLLRSNAAVTATFLTGKYTSAQNPTAAPTSFPAKAKNITKG